MPGTGDQGQMHSCVYVTTSSKTACEVFSSGEEVRRPRLDAGYERLWVEREGREALCEQGPLVLPTETPENSAGPSQPGAGGGPRPCWDKVGTPARPQVLLRHTAQS